MLPFLSQRSSLSLLSSRPLFSCRHHCFWVRELPLTGARQLSRLAVGNKLWLVAYVVVMFVLLPLSGILIFN